MDIESKPPRLLAQVRAAIRVHQLSQRTEQAYLAWVRRYVRFHRLRHPATMGTDEVVAFLSHLATEGRVVQSTQMQALSALLLLYRDVIRKPLLDLRALVRARAPARLSVVLTLVEVERVLGVMREEPWLVALLLYGSGLRLMEALTLRVKDVDLERGEIRVRRGKGGKDRVTVLPEAVKVSLGAHLVRVKDLHQRDLAAGAGSVETPRRVGSEGSVTGPRLGVAVALSGAPAVSGPADRAAAAPSSAPHSGTAGRAVGGSSVGHREADDLSHLPAFLCDAPVGGRV